MKELKFRALTASEIECRVQRITASGCSILLYKDARVDQNLLDETVGAYNWQKHYNRDNANCIVSIYDPDKDMWIEKEDTGTESNTEAEKGLASDSFKRACFCWGIGRELYTAPFIWITAGDCKIEEKNGRKICADRFSVKWIRIENKVITGLQIYNERLKRIVFSMGEELETTAPEPSAKAAQEATKIGETQIALLTAEAKIAGVSVEKILECAGVTDIKDITATQYIQLMKKLKLTQEGR